MRFMIICRCCNDYLRNVLGKVCIFTWKLPEASVQPALCVLYLTFPVCYVFLQYSYLVIILQYSYLVFSQYSYNLMALTLSETFPSIVVPGPPISIALFSFPKSLLSLDMTIYFVLTYSCIYLFVFLLLRNIRNSSASWASVVIHLNINHITNL